jgi:hypothetical protein
MVDGGRTFPRCLCLSLLKEVRTCRWLITIGRPKLTCKARRSAISASFEFLLERKPSIRSVACASDGWKSVPPSPWLFPEPPSLFTPLCDVLGKSLLVTPTRLLSLRPGAFDPSEKSPPMSGPEGKRSPRGTRKSSGSLQMGVAFPRVWAGVGRVGRPDGRCGRAATRRSRRLSL